MMQTIQNFDTQLMVPLVNYFSIHGGIFNKIFAEYAVYALPIILLVLWFALKDKYVSMRAFFAVIIAWPIIAQIIGKIIYRPRPFEAGVIQELIFHRPTYSFPSDHAAALFAVAFSLWFSGYKKIAYAMFIYAIIICFFRVATGIHWPTDIVGGIIVGLIAAYMIKLLEKILKPVYDFIIKIMHYLRLA